MVMSESQKIQRFILVWIAVKSADDDLNVLNLSQNRLGIPVQKNFGHCEN